MKILGNFTGRCAAREAREILAWELKAFYDVALDSYHYAGRDANRYWLRIIEEGPESWQIQRVTKEEVQIESPG